MAEALPADLELGVDCEGDGEEDAACFFLTQAYVFALSAGLPQAAGLNRRLAEQGRDDLQLDLA